MADTTVEGFLQHHHHMVIESVVQKTNELAEKEAHRHQRDHEVALWKRERQQLIDALDIATGYARSNVASAMQPPAPPQVWGPAGDAAAEMVPGGDLVRMTQYQRANAQMVQKLNERRANEIDPECFGHESSNEELLPATKFRDLSRENHRSQKDDPLDKCWNMLRGMLGELPEQSEGYDPAKKANIRPGLCLDFLGELGTPLQRRAAHNFSDGARQALERSKQEYLDSQRSLQQAPPDPLDNQSVPLTVRFTVAAAQKRFQQDQDYPFDSTWATVYYCLRCYGIRVAIGYLTYMERDNSNINQELGVARRALECLQSFREAWEREAGQMSSMAFSDVSEWSAWHYARRTARDHFDTLLQRGQEYCCMFELAVFNLASLMRPYSFIPQDPYSDEIGATDDWLWQCLWFVTAAPQADSKAPPQLGGGLTDVTPGDTTKDHLGVYDLGVLHKVISENGEKFGEVTENQNGSPFEYALFLLAVNDFPRAINYLWRRTCRDEALHMAIALHYHGALRVSRGGDSFLTEIEVNLAKFLSTYCADWQRRDFHMAFEYYMMLRTDDRITHPASVGDALCDAVGKLMLDADCEGNLAGFISVDGDERIDVKKSFCAKYMNVDRLNGLLAHTAREAKARGSSARAIDLYRLAGLWDQVVLEIFINLSRLLADNDDRSAADRQKWWTVAQQTSEKYLRGKEAASKVSNALMTAFQIMAALYYFTDLVWGAKEYSAALQHVREGPFKFIPVRDDEKQVQKGFITRLLIEVSRINDNVPMLLDISDWSHHLFVFFDV